MQASAQDDEDAGDRDNVKKAKSRMKPAAGAEKVLKRKTESMQKAKAK